MGDPGMSASDLAVARQFLASLAIAAQTGELDDVYPLLAADVEWLTPQRDLRGVDEVRRQLSWLSPHQTLEIEFDEKIDDLGDGRIVTDVHETYRVKETGTFAYERDRRIVLTIREGKVARYEMRFAG